MIDIILRRSTRWSRLYHDSNKRCDFLVNMDFFGESWYCFFD